MTEKSSWFFVPLTVVVLVTAVTAAVGQETTESRTVAPGDTVSIERPVNSSFHSWEVDQYDVRKLSLILKEPADTIGNYRFVFETLEEGQVTLTFSKYLNTALQDEKLETHSVAVNIEEQPPEPAREEHEPSPGPQPEETPEPPESSPAPEPEPEPSTPGPSGVEQAVWDRANELIEVGQHEQARELIDEEIQETAGPTRQQWMELKADSFMDQDNYAEAIGIWETMVDEFPNGPRAKWLTQIANAHMQNDQPDQAQLAYLEVRHRFPDSSHWVETMRKLAEIAIGNNEIDRARRILERTRSRVNTANHPELLMKLAEIYDRFPSTRDYPRAVRFYESAADAFDESDTRVRTARDRASYLNQNFLQFGTE